MLQSPGGLNVVADSLLFICLSHFWHAHHPSLPILPLPRLPRLSSPSSPFMSPRFALVNHTRRFSLVSAPACLFPASSLLCAPQGQRAARRHQLPLQASLHRQASRLASYSYLCLSACPSPWLFICPHLPLPLLIIHMPVSLSFLFAGPLSAILEVLRSVATDCDSHVVFECCQAFDKLNAVYSHMCVHILMCTLLSAPPSSKAALLICSTVLQLELIPWLQTGCPLLLRDGSFSGKRFSQLGVKTCPCKVLTSTSLILFRILVAPSVHTLRQLVKLVQFDLREAKNGSKTAFAIRVMFKYLKSKHFYLLP